MKYLNGVLATAAALAFLAPAGAQAAVNAPTWLGASGSPGISTQADEHVLIACDYGCSDYDHDYDYDHDHDKDKKHRDNGGGNGVDPAPGNSGNTRGDDADGHNTPGTIDTRY
jgi:hypothetical protein